MPACRSIVEQLLDAAIWAPTHGRTEPWKFVVLGRAKQEELLDLTLKVRCTLCFLSCQHQGLLTLRSKRLSKAQQYWYQHRQDEMMEHCRLRKRASVH